MDRQINVENLQTYCRACLNIIKGNKYNINDLPITLYRNFQDCINNLGSESFPENICFSCYWRLKSFHEFRELCQKSNLFLKNLFKSESEDSFNEVSESVETRTLSIGLESSDKQESKCIILHDIEESTDTYKSKKPPVLKQSIDKIQLKKSNHECKICKRIYFSESALRLHMRFHSKEKTEKIQISCNDSTKIGYQWDSAESSNHDESDNEIKQLLENETTSDNTTEIAFGNNLELNNQQTNCNMDDLKKSSTNNQDDVGIKDTFPNLPNTTCKICFMQCASIQSLRKHLLQHTNTRQYKCDKCDKAFHVKGMLALHEKEVHGDAPVEIPCKYGCGKVFHRSGTATTHYRVIHRGMKRIHKSCVCEDCGKVCLNISMLKEHRYQHLPLKESPYKCDVCNRHFRARRKLSEHRQRHETIKKYQCPHCDVRKATRGELNMHVNFHTKEKKYPCPLCSKVYFTAQSLRCHKVNVHLIIKKFKCRYCDETFTKTKERAKHESQH